MFLLCSNYIVKKLLLLLRWDMCKFRERFGGMDRFKGVLKCKEWVNKALNKKLIRDVFK